MAPKSRAGALVPRDSGTRGRGTRPGLGKRTTCLLDFIRFQEEATGFTLKITRLPNSSDTHASGFRTDRPRGSKVQLCSHCPSPFSWSRRCPGVTWALLGSPSSSAPADGGLAGVLPSPGTPPALGHPSVAGVRPPKLSMAPSAPDAGQAAGLGHRCPFVLASLWFSTRIWPRNMSEGAPGRGRL